jgi:hypothetical protein
MPRKRKQTVSRIQNLQTGESSSSSKRQKSAEPEPDLLDGSQTIELGVCLKYPRNS